jgi:hypothetical protein
MPWHGPRGDCGCCNIEPPPPDCACELNDCILEGKFQFTGVKAVAEWDDEFETIETSSRTGTFRSCVCAPYTEVWVRSYSGMSAVNGTYDAVYVVPDGSDWVESDPDEDPCGWWFFPLIEVDLSYTNTFTRTFPNGCDPDVFQDASRVIPVYYDTYAGRFIRKVDTFPEIPLTYVLGGSPAGRTFTLELTPYDCTTRDPYTLNAEIGVTANTSTLGFFGVVQANGYADAPIAPTFSIGGVGIGELTQTATYDGQLGRVRPYRKGSFVPLGDPCQIDYESAENTLDAFYLLTNPFNDSCGYLTIPVVRELEWNAFNRKHSILLNA